jgi:hypothetical protein
VTLLDALATAATSHLQLRGALALAKESALELRAEVERREMLVSRATLLAQLAHELSAVSTERAASRRALRTPLLMVS